MENKLKLIIGIVAGIFILASAILFIALIEKNTRPIKEDYFTAEPEPWVENTPYDNVSNNIKINVPRATRQKSIYEINKQEYFDDQTAILFSHVIYQGESPEQQYMSGNISIKIGPEMDPDDGIMEGFILAKKEEERFAFYLFVDQDWKDKMRYTNVLWSNNFDSGITDRPFNFDKETNGIYIDKVEGTFDWFQKSPRKGGIYLGEISKTTYESKNLSDTSFIYVR
ncbi:MAG: hypothetical protein NDI94_02135 [Candidatus Woesearchaeota archaeon]|nr:hypothetical protein [Candidatus Woesearchaeota archaeon]